MHPLFKITPEDIRKLNDAQARELVARLCRAELRTKMLSEGYVSWGGDQRAKDGGVDVKVDIDPVVGISGYVPKDSVVYQVKAEKFGKAKIPGEMAPKNRLRPFFNELAGKDGAYIIISTRDNLSHAAISDRINTMEVCLSSNGFKGKVSLDFYDSRKLADWVEQHPAIGTWMKNELGKSLSGWKPYAPWAYREENIEAEYIIDDKVKVFPPDSINGVTITNAINCLRKDLQNNASVRLVGLSGVGKTRLVQALFDARIQTEQPALNPENVLYTDLSNDPTPQPLVMADALISVKSDSIFIVDNCGSEVHQKLTEVTTKAGSKLRLITVEYDIRDDLPESTRCYKLEASSDEVIKELLTRKYSFLSVNDMRKIIEFSEGNSRVAFALASSSQIKGELAKLEDSDLFKRLFFQKNEINDELMRCAEVASLLYSFDAEDHSGKSELAILASLSDLSISTLSRNIAEIQRRGLVQERGKWRAVLPHAIANRLASKAVENYPKTILIEKFVDNASSRIARSFSRRLGYLHESKQAQAIVESWLKPDDRFGNVTKLNDLDQQIFANIAPVNQQTALAALSRSIHDKQFVSLDNYSRHYYAQIARSLAYEQELFDQAVEVLIHFALEEPDDYNANSTTQILGSLFFSHLSGTQATIQQRAAIVKKLVNSNEILRRNLGLVLLKKALEAGHFSCFYGFDFGARTRGYGWYPRTKVELADWYQTFIAVVLELNASASPIANQARKILGKQFRGLWCANLHQEMTAAALALTKFDAWPEGWLAARETLLFDGKDLSQESFAALTALEKQLAPNNLLDEIRAKVLSQESYVFDMEDDESTTTLSGYGTARCNAEELGKLAASDSLLLSNLLPDLLKPNYSDKFWNFGVGVSNIIENPKEIICEARSKIEKLEISNVSLNFIRGLLFGWCKRKPNDVGDFLDKAINDEIWGLCFPELQLSIELDEKGFTRLIKSLELGKAPSRQFSSLGYGKTTDPLSVEQIFSLIELITKKPDSGLAIAIDILWMVIYSGKEKDTQYQTDLAMRCVGFLVSLDWRSLDHKNGRVIDHLTKISEFSLKSEKSNERVSIVISKMLDYMKSGHLFLPVPDPAMLKPFFKYFPKQALDLLFTANTDGGHTASLKFVQSLNWDDAMSRAFSVIDPNALIDWCNLVPNERYLLAANLCQLFESTPLENGEGDRLVLSKIAKTVFQQGKDKKAILKIFSERFHPRSWSGSLSQILAERLVLLDELVTPENYEINQEITKLKQSLFEIMTLEIERENAENRRTMFSFE